MHLWEHFAGISSLWSSGSCFKKLWNKYHKKDFRRSFFVETLARGSYLGNNCTVCRVNEAFKSCWKKCLRGSAEADSKMLSPFLTTAWERTLKTQNFWQMLLHTSQHGSTFRIFLVWVKIVAVTEKSENQNDLIVKRCTIHVFETSRWTEHVLPLVYLKSFCD